MIIEGDTYVFCGARVVVREVTDHIVVLDLGRISVTASRRDFEEVAIREIEADPTHPIQDWWPSLVWGVVVAVIAGVALWLAGVVGVAL